MCILNMGCSQNIMITDQGPWLTASCSKVIPEYLGLVFPCAHPLFPGLQSHHRALLGKEINPNKSSVNRASMWHSSITMCTVHSEAQSSFLPFLLLHTPGESYTYTGFFFLLNYQYFITCLDEANGHLYFLTLFASISHLAKSYFSNTGEKHSQAEMHTEMHTEMHGLPCRWVPKINSNQKVTWKKHGLITK